VRPWIWVQARKRKVVICRMRLIDRIARLEEPSGRCIRYGWYAIDDCDGGERRKWRSATQ
jgi:hypothetical protein